MRKMDSGDRDGGNNKERRKGDALKVDEECTVVLLSCVSDRFQVTPWQAFVPHLSQINGLSRDFSPFL